MTTPNFDELREGDILRHRVSHNLYRVCRILHAHTPQEIDQCRADGKSWIPLDCVHVIQIRHGKLFGPVRIVKPHWLHYNYVLEPPALEN